MSLMSILLIDLQTPQLLTKTTTKVGPTSKRLPLETFRVATVSPHINGSLRPPPPRSHPVPGALSPRGWRWGAGGAGSLCCSDEVSLAFAEHLLSTAGEVANGMSYLLGGTGRD